MNGASFNGIGVAIITPFKGEKVNFSKFEELLERQIKGGMDAIIVCGTTGEAATLDEKEYKDIIQFAVEKVDKRIPVIAGAGCNNTRHAIKLSQICEKLGVDGILSVTPYYNKTSQHGLIQHFQNIAQSVELPIILYNVPSRTGLNMNAETTISLSQTKNIIGVKECNLGQIEDIVKEVEDNFSVYTGNDDEIISALSIGAKGVISAVANIIPEDLSKITHLYLDGYTEQAESLFKNTLKLINAMFCDVSPIPIKEALNIWGKQVGECRLPLVKTTEENKNLILQELRNYESIAKVYS